MRTISVIGGGVLLAFAIGGMVCWIMGFDMFKEMLIDGTPVFISHLENQTKLPGRLVGVLLLIAPLGCALAGVWLLRSGLSRAGKLAP